MPRRNTAASPETSTATTESPAPQRRSSGPGRTSPSRDFRLGPAVSFQASGMIALLHGEAAGADGTSSAPYPRLTYRWVQTVTGGFTDSKRRLWPYAWSEALQQRRHER